MPNWEERTWELFKGLVMQQISKDRKPSFEDLYETARMAMINYKQLMKNDMEKHPTVLGPVDTRK
jgi:hypothetical protein